MPVFGKVRCAAWATWMGDMHQSIKWLIQTFRGYCSR
jgi:hypothetical protein